MAALATGCSSSDDDGGADEASDALETPRQGGHLVLPSIEPHYMNPILETRFERASMFVFEGLVGLDNELEAVPRLAESWKVSEDGKRIEFSLRDDVRWHDGEPLSSEDVAFTFEALRGTEAPTVWQTYMADVDAVETPDDHTVVVTYDEPYAPALKTWTMGILPAHIYDDADDIKDSEANYEPVGTGPYRLARWERGERIVLSANQDWWYQEDDAARVEGAGRRGEEPRGFPYVDSIEIRFGIQNQLGALEENRIDFADVAHVSAWSQTQLGDFREHFEASSVIESEFWGIAWNSQRGPLDDPEVRIALSHALDRGRIINDVLLGQAQPLSAPFFPTMFGDDPSIAPYPFDLDEAAERLDAAGYPEEDGERLSIDLIIARSPHRRPAEEVLAIYRSDLAEIGVNLEIHTLDPSEFENRRVLFEYDALYFGWVPDIPDPDPSILLHSSQIEGGLNLAAFAHGEVDDLLESARSSADRADRAELYRELHRLVHELEPYTMLYAPYGHYAWNRRVRGVNPSDIGPQPPFPGAARWFVVPTSEAATASQL